MIEVSAASILLSIAAGLGSVLSPCVLPVVPVVIAGVEQRDRLRPLLVVTGLSITFIAMGVVSSLFGSLLIGKSRYIEQAGGLVILIMGLMVITDRSVFKRLYRLSNIGVEGGGRLGGLVLGMALGVVWVPCIGPMLSSILALVGTDGRLSQGVLLLACYSLGFALPMLALGYSSRMIQQRIKSVSGSSTLRYITGGILVVFGLYVTFIGNFAFLSLPV